MPRRRLILAVRDRMRHRAAAQPAAATAAPPRPARPRRARPAPPDPAMEQLVAEAKYHRNRYELAHAKVVSASPSATTPGRLQQLQRAATAAEDRLAHARDGGKGAG